MGLGVGVTAENSYMKKCKIISREPYGDACVATSVLNRVIRG